MLVECKQCGAPLEVGSNASIVRCSYCGASSRVRTMHTIAQAVPAGWRPPQTWTPATQGAPLPYRAPPKQISIQALIFGIVMISLLVTACPFLFLPLLFWFGFRF